MAKKKDFSELTRVQIPATLNLMRLGYTYLHRNSKEMIERDPDTNILVSVFKERFLTLRNVFLDKLAIKEVNDIVLCNWNCF